MVLRAGDPRTATPRLQSLHHISTKVSYLAAFHPTRDLISSAFVIDVIHPLDHALQYSLKIHRDVTVVQLVLRAKFPIFLLLRRFVEEPTSFSTSFSTEIFVLEVEESILGDL
jgi:hypothetical protein